MSHEKDELKQLFDSAFAAEQIPFDAAGWAQMEAMLDKKSKRKAAWYWYSAAAAVLALVALLPFLRHKEDTYIPRNAQPAFSSYEKDSKPLNEDYKAINKGIAASSNSVSNRAVAQLMQSNTAYNEVDAYETKNDYGCSGELTENRTDLEFLERLEAIIPVTPYVYDSLNSWLGCGKITEENKWQRYLIVGVTKSHSADYGMFANTGQSFGLGLTYKLKNHIYLSGELSLSRDLVGFEKSTSVTNYGLTATKINQKIVTSELIYIDLPVLLQYRNNRLSLGTGPLVQYMNGLKNSENMEQQNLAGETTSNQELQKGYFTWSDYKRLGFGWQFDANYEVFENIFIGTRACAGANISATDAKISRNRFEFYLKYNL